jgi:hypothetical protein
MSVGPCDHTPPAYGTVVFEPAAFKISYPAFATVDDSVLQGYFDLATLFLNNRCGSRVANGTIRERLLNLIVAHLAALFSGENGQPRTGVVGRLASATEGTVTGQFQYSSEVSESEAFWIQTQYGATYWALTATYRTAVYVPNARRAFGFGYRNPYDRSLQ